MLSVCHEFEWRLPSRFHTAILCLILSSFCGNFKSAPFLFRHFSSHNFQQIFLSFRLISILTDWQINHLLTWRQFKMSTRIVKDCMGAWSVDGYSLRLGKGLGFMTEKSFAFLGNFAISNCVDSQTLNWWQEEHERREVVYSNNLSWSLDKNSCQRNYKYFKLTCE